MRFLPAAAALVFGVLYGMFARWSFNRPELQPVWAIMGVAFLTAVPLALGAITVFVAERRQPLTTAGRIFLPWLSTAAALLGTFLAGWEGLICIIFLLPLGLVFASVGGVLAGWWRRRSPGSTPGAMAVVMLLPYLIAPVERLIPVQEQVRAVGTSIEIQAPASIVWEQIARVRPIADSELPATWVHRIGFPKPIEAIVNRDGVGAVRRATFHGGVEFVETVTDWRKDSALGFTVQVDPAHIPSTTLDPHVTIGGPYFDVLRARYEIEPAGAGRIRLRLVSWHRLSTTVNWYASLWSDAVMGDIQRSILQVVRQRCEAAVPGSR